MRESQKRHNRTNERQRHGNDDGERRVPALVLPRQHEIDEQQRQAEHDIHLLAHELLLVGHRAPLESHAGRKCAPRDLLHQLHHIARGEAWGGKSDYRR